MFTASSIDLPAMNFAHVIHPVAQAPGGHPIAVSLTGQFIRSRLQYEIAARLSIIM